MSDDEKPLTLGDSDAESDDNAKAGLPPAKKSAPGEEALQLGDDGSETEDSDTSSEEQAGLPSDRRASDDEEDEAEENEEGEGAGEDAEVQLWLPIDYDSMTQEEFYKLLKSKSREDRMKEKNLAVEKKAKEAQQQLEAFTDDNTKGYKYSDMLQRVFAEIREKNPELGEGAGKQVKLPVPKTEKIGSKRTALTNFQAMCHAMNREVEHVKDFIEKHLTTTGSIDANNCLILKLQNVKSNQIEAVFQKYVLEFCQCSNCKGIDTELSRDANNRLWNLKCRSCRASRTVQAASSATYQATTTKRSRLRNKAAL